MKHIIALVLLAAGFPTLAQPVLTTATSNPTTGLTLTFSHGFFFSPGSSGAGQYWEFRTEDYDVDGKDRYEPCSPYNYCNNFPGTNLVRNRQYFLGTIYSEFSYFLASSTGLAITGDSSGNGNFVYSDPEDVLRFPMTYKSSFTDNWSGTHIKTGVSYIRKGTDTVTGIGWGTLKFVYGPTYSNALCIKTVRTYTDSATTGAVIKYNSTVYTWYDTLHKTFILQSEQLETNERGRPTTWTAYC